MQAPCRKKRHPGEFTPRSEGLIVAAKTIIKSALNRWFKDYRINWIFASPAKTASSSEKLNDVAVAITAEHCQVLANSPTAKMRGSVSFNKSGLDGYVIEQSGQPLCVAHFADCVRYDRAGTWPIASDEMALMDIATEEAMRGRGLAVHLIYATTKLLLQQDKRRVIAFIWWSNTPSVRAFKKAGWRRIGLSVEILGASKWRSLRIPLW
jgi:GNAT superfamily N-acetyltransferase